MKAKQIATQGVTSKMSLCLETGPLHIQNPYRTQERHKEPFTSATLKFASTRQRK